MRKAGETTKEYAVKTEKEVLFTGLDEATDYETGITTVCAPGDTAQVTIVRFTTLTTIPCDQVSNIEATPTTGSVTLAWESEASKFNVRFRQTGNETWTERVVEGTNTTTFTGLTHNTNYEYSIQTVCSAAEGDVSDYTEAVTVKTIEITCFTPTNLLADPLVYNSATLSWEGDATKYELSWAKTGEEWTVVEVESKSYPLTGLTSETDYQAKVRAICQEGDTSTYSPVYEFKTLPVPACPVPTDLTVSSVSDRSARLSWTADDANTSWNLHYRPGTVMEWTDVLALTDKSYELTDLAANTVYLWQVKAYCAGTANESAYASVNQFTTAQTGIASIGNALKVNISNRIVSVLNPAGAYINNIQLYAIDGSLLQDFSVRSSDNVLIPTEITQKIAIVKVIGNDTQATFKMLVK
jgi:hypothetical protein